MNVNEHKELLFPTQKKSQNKNTSVMIIMSCNSNTTGATSGAGTAYTSGASDITPGF
jgi:hypothetical protein